MPSSPYTLLLVTPLSAPLLLSCTWPLEAAELVGTVGTLLLPYKSFNLAAAGVNCLTRVVVVAGRNVLRNIGRSGVFIMLAQLSPTTGESPSRPPGAVLPRGERKAEPSERPEKSVRYGRYDPGSTDISGIVSLRSRAEDPSPSATFSARGELQHRNTTCGVASGFEFSALLGKRGRLRRLDCRRYWGYPDWEEEEESKASDWRFVALVLKVRAEGNRGWLT